MKTGETVRIFLLGAAVALLAALALRADGGKASAQMSVAPPSTSNLIALTTNGPGNNSVTLFLVDPAKQTIAYYTAKENQPFSLRQVRWFKSDLSIFRSDGKDGDRYAGGGISVKDAETLAATTR